MITSLLFLAYEDSDIKPGWIALGIVAALALATYLLWRSMNTQLRKIKVPPREAPSDAPTDSPDDNGVKPEA